MGLRNRANFNEFNIFFITTTCNKWLHLLSLGNSMRIVVGSLMFCCNKYQASIMAYILMPNHIHLLIYFEDGKNRISFMRYLKNLHLHKLEKKLKEQKLIFLKKLGIQKESNYLKFGKTGLMNCI